MLTEEEMNSYEGPVNYITHHGVIEDTYVADGFTGGNAETVKRIVGEKGEDGKYDGTLSQILRIGGFEVKEIVIEGDMSQSDHNLMNNTCFGYVYDPKLGMMKVRFTVNLSKKKRNLQHPDQLKQR